MYDLPGSFHTWSWPAPSASPSSFLSSHLSHGISYFPGFSFSGASSSLSYGWPGLLRRRYNFMAWPGVWTTIAKTTWLTMFHGETTSIPSHGWPRTQFVSLSCPSNSSAGWSIHWPSNRQLLENCLRVWACQYHILRLDGRDELASSPKLLPLTSRLSIFHDSSSFYVIPSSISHQNVAFELSHFIAY